MPSRRSPSASLDRIADLAQTLAPLLDDAFDAGARRSSGLEFAGGGKGYIDSDPTATIALDPQRAQIRKATRRAAAPQAEIIFTGPWNISVGGFPETDPLFMLYNDALKRVAADMRVRYADMFPIFNPQGDIDAETAAICALTLLCVEGDIHPSDAGYRAIADEIWDASNYARLVE